LLVQKHENLAKKYSLELDVGERVSVLREKRDQLRHWIAAEKPNEIRVRELGSVEEELGKLENSGLLKPSRYYKDLKANIDEHNEAKKYWVEKSKEVQSK